jgi:hypothetical protein
MVYFQTKNPNSGQFWWALGWKMLTYLMGIWNILRTPGMFYDYLVHFVFSWYIIPSFGIMYQEKSGNPGLEPRSDTTQSDQIGLNFAFWGKKYLTIAHLRT